LNIVRYTDPEVVNAVKTYLGRNSIPAAPLGHRCLVLAKPKELRTRGGLHLLDHDAPRPFMGRVIAAGLQAMDTLRSHGAQVGDEVWFGKFAGIIEMWTHLIEEGDPEWVCQPDHDWRTLPQAEGDVARSKCDRCGAVVADDPIFVVNADDLIASVELARRLESKQLEIVLVQTTEGEQHQLRSV
jgi:co-chaperonin GroES (HSP10)